MMTDRCKVSAALLCLLVMSFLIYLAAAVDTETRQQCSNGESSSTCHCGIPGMHGKPGSPGLPGRDGRDGLEGAKGDQGRQGEGGPPGPPGATGAAGVNGQNGVKGEPGIQGPPGQKGERGETGARRKPGTTGAMPFKNWKECVWKNTNDDKDNGLIKECVFTKNFSDTALHVSWTGALRVYNCQSCCKRWYFTFNGAECSAPFPIDGVVYLGSVSNQNPHRVRHIEGHCNNIHKGRVSVGFWVGNCQSFGNVNAYTGWNSVSRIFVEEVPSAQA